ncbi:MAG TPA: hypothetical protein VK809_11600 [Bacteroidia bacterium]|jgi:hypothetical protein|nr:hypothetical protein [Bacteroidia bacterium]
MNIQAKKLNLIEKLISLSDTTTINKIDKLLNKTVVSAYEAKQKPMTGSEYKSRLDKAEKDLKHGRVISQDELEKESENW